MTEQAQPDIERRGLQIAALVAWTGFRPPPRLTVSQWADRYRILTTRTSASPGRFRTDYAPYQREAMDVIDDHRVEVVVLKWPSQTGKSEVPLNILGRHMHLDPAPILMVQPTIEMSEAFSKDRIDTMIEACPELSELLPARSTRNSVNTLRHKVFPGGHLSMAGANSPASLASRPMRIVLIDECDRFPLSAGMEGDPIEIARKRLTTFGHLAKLVIVSSPTIQSLSPIDTWWERSDQRRYHVPCLLCGHTQYLVWAQVKWRDHEPETARYECESCGGHWDDRDVNKGVTQGEWIPGKPEVRNIAGFHIPEMVSPWRRLAQTVEDFLRVKGDREQLQVWTNTALAETFEDETEEIEPSLLYRRREYYRAEVENGSVLVAGVDVQKTYLACEVVSYGEQEESWSVAYDHFMGNPALPDVWQQLSEHLRRLWTRVDGEVMPIRLMGIDSGGHFTDEVYQFCRRAGPTVALPCKGYSQPGKPIATVPTKPGEKGVYLTMLGADTGKELLMRRLQLLEPGPGYCHFPVDPAYSEEYFDQLTAEKAVTRYRKGVASVEWVKVRRRNEALDCRVIAQAMLRILIHRSRVELITLSEDLKAPSAPELPPTPAPSPPSGRFQRRKLL